SQSSASGRPRGSSGAAAEPLRAGPSGRTRTSTRPVRRSTALDASRFRSLASAGHVSNLTAARKRMRGAGLPQRTTASASRIPTRSRLPWSLRREDSRPLGLQDLEHRVAEAVLGAELWDALGFEVEAIAGAELRELLRAELAGHQRRQLGEEVLESAGRD